MSPRTNGIITRKKPVAGLASVRRLFAESLGCLVDLVLVDVGRGAKILKF